MIHHVQGTKIKADVTSGTMEKALEEKRQWNGIVKVQKEKKNLSNKNSLIERSFKNEVKIKTFPEKQTLRKFVANRSAL